MGMTLSGRNHALFTTLCPSILQLAITKVRAEVAPIHLDLPTRRQLLQTAYSSTSLPLLPVWKSHLPPPAGSLPADDVRSPLLPASASASQPAWPRHGSSVLPAASPALWTENRACSPVPFLLPWPSLFPVMTAFKRKMQRICVTNPRNVVLSPRTTTGMWDSSAASAQTSHGTIPGVWHSSRVTCPDWFLHSAAMSTCSSRHWT